VISEAFFFSGFSSSLELSSLEDSGVFFFISAFLSSSSSLESSESSSLEEVSFFFALDAVSC